MSILSKFVGFLEIAGKDFEKGLGFVVKEAPAASALASILFPASSAISPLVSSTLSLLQNSILAIEQKYTASGVQSGTGVQKAAEVLSLAGPAATQLLTAANVPNVNDAYLTSIITAIVGVLNATQPTKAA